MLRNVVKKIVMELLYVDIFRPRTNIMLLLGMWNCCCNKPLSFTELFRCWNIQKHSNFPLMFVLCLPYKTQSVGPSYRTFIKEFFFTFAVNLRTLSFWLIFRNIRDILHTTPYTTPQNFISFSPKLLNLLILHGVLMETKFNYSNSLNYCCFKICVWLSTFNFCQLRLLFILIWVIK